MGAKTVILALGKTPLNILIQPFHQRSNCQLHRKHTGAHIIYIKYGK